jgi:LysR family transcriptional regulator, glycine cleavage system transcriptional activator
MPGLPPLHALRAFEAAARHLSFARAAAELNLTPSAISHQIRHLEESLGRRLFERRARGLELTPLGQIYFPLVRNAFEQLAQATVLIGGERPDTQKVLTISCTPSFAMAWLIPRLTSFQAAHPDIEVRLDTSTRLVDFARDGVDVGIRFGLGEWSGVTAEFLFSETLFPVCSPSLLAAKGGVAGPSDVSRFALLHVLPYVDDWRLWLTAAGATGVDPERGPRFDSGMAAYKAAEEGLGMAIGRGMLIGDALAKGRLVAPFDISLPSRHAYYVACASGTEGVRKIAQFRAWLEREIAALGFGTAAKRAEAR